jgi:hypothetical protein
MELGTGLSNRNASFLAERRGRGQGRHLLSMASWRRGAESVKRCRMLIPLLYGSPFLSYETPLILLSIVAVMLYSAVYWPFLKLVSPHYGLL